ncbi:two-component system sporulation sensor kinase A [Paenibacillus cellulosilyticus]|uniref:histidine kinase n=1 Tax=Paenibacillus cellulosilyticus TaxID=375489 RepID=A0A2V2YZU3_9BACL|nr:PAS domain-containing sensor histidine kinase [Paenibacillus cellulosilyticus]PWW08543.1 two-component system sporulation sensor kinase A [Paenibacillus cellulosilyticus]QKS48120.1 PAS domain S-box protein [Paenibacillus cellulosilyticus]
MVRRWLSKLRRVISSLLLSVKEHELRRDAQRMAMLGSWEYDLESGRFHGTREFYVLFDIGADERLSLEQVLKQVHPDDLDKVKDYYRIASDSCSVHALDFRVVRSNGQTHWLHTRFKAFGPKRCVGIVQDSTKTHSLEDEVKLLNYHMTAFIDRHIDPVVIWDADGRVARVNPAFTALFGYEREEVEGLSSDECGFIPPGYHLELQGACQTAIEQGKALVIDTLRLKKDGTPLNMLLSITPMAGGQNKSATWIAILRDHTGQQEAYRQVREAKAELESFIAYNPDAIGFFHNDGSVRQVNAAFERVFGYSNQAQALGTMKLMEMPFARSIAHSDEQLKGFIQCGGIQSQEIDVVRGDGTIMTGLLSMIPFPDQEGFAIIMKDVSELRETKDLLGRSEMLSMIGQLAAGVAHEIRNPLTSLKGFIRLIEPALQTRELRYLDIMKGELDRIELIVNEMLVLSKPQIMELALYPMDELLDYIIELLSTQAVMKGIEIERLFDPVPPIECEQRRIKQVFVNLLKNAIESMEENGVIKVCIERADEDNVRVVVKDQGKGMPPEQLARLTEPFYTTKEKGNGLGLMMTASIVERHGGTIHFDSVVGVGTTVSVTLPIKQQKQELLSGKLLKH